MKYSSGAAFRRALEDRLRSQSFQSGVPLAGGQMRLSPTSKTRGLE